MGQEGRPKRRWLDNARADLRESDGTRRKTQEEVAGQCKSRSEGE